MTNKLKSLMTEALACSVLATGAAGAQTTPTEPTSTVTKTTVIKADQSPCPAVSGQPVQTVTSQTEADARQTQIDAQQAQRAQRDAQSHGGGILGDVIRGTDAASALSNIHWGHKRPDPKPAPQSVASAKDCGPAKTTTAVLDSTPITTASVAAYPSPAPSATGTVATTNATTAALPQAVIEKEPQHLLAGTGPKTGITAGLPLGDTRKSPVEPAGGNVSFQFQGGQGSVSWMYSGSDILPTVQVHLRNAALEADVAWDKDGRAVVSVEGGGANGVGVVGRRIVVSGYSPNLSAEIMPAGFKAEGEWKPVFKMGKDYDETQANIRARYAANAAALADQQKAQTHPR